MSHAAEMTRTYPWTDVIDGHEIEFRLMTRADRDSVVAFAQSLKPEDLMFLRLDITQPDVIDQWIGHIEDGNTVSVLACEDGNVIGYGTLHFNETWWTRHLGQVRILVLGDRRKLGLGRRLAVEIFQIAREKKIDRIFVQMAADQPYVRQLFEDLGFRAEALLTDWVMDRGVLVSMSRGHHRTILVLPTPFAVAQCRWKSLATSSGYWNSNRVPRVP